MNSIITQLSGGRFPEIFRDDALRLETRRMWLRWPVAADAAALGEIASREAAARPSVRWPAALSPDEAERRIEQARIANESGHGLVLALTVKGRPETLIGLIGAAADPEAADTLLIAYQLDVAHQGQGLMTEAVCTIIANVFRYTGAERIRAAGGVGNAASRRVLEKAGFRPMGSRSPSRRAGGDGRDYTLTREAWLGRRAPAGLEAGEEQRAAATCGCAA